MRLFRTFAFAALLLPVTAWAADPYSYAQPDQVRMTHLDLDVKIDFEHKQLNGQATLKLNWENPQATTLVLDTRDLTIVRVEGIDANGKVSALTFALGPPTQELGSKLTIAAPQQPPRVRISYTTSPDASGLQWLIPEQTADKKLPFMFSQSESIHARSWVPLQDSPAIRFTYHAHVTAPDNVRVVMSAINHADHPLDGNFSFNQPHPIPSYLLAIAAGDIVARQTGPRSAVYAEHSVINRAAREFEDTEKMLKTAEQLYGPYIWGRYDLLVLPPSFPFGGMENPNMTFVTPTLLVGDKSLVSVISHELAHSWSGNLVTSAAWRDIWLNEGFTTYVQGRITEAVYGKRQADEEILLSARALQKIMGGMSANLQKLAPDPHGMSADDTLSDVAYDKGAWFLRTLEQRFGRRIFDAYLKGYFAHFAFQSITTEQMMAYLKANLFDKYPGKMAWSQAQAWVYQPGIPPDALLPNSPRLDTITQERAAFLNGTLPADQLDAKSWNTREWMYFLDGLPDVTPLDKIKQLDAAWHLTGTPNAEIGMRWYMHAIAAGDKEVWPAAADHLTRIGRLYLIIPLYRAFAITPDGLAYAKRIYAKIHSGYHPITREAVRKVLDLNKAKQDH